jgi:hypothetical protein
MNVCGANLKKGGQCKGKAMQNGRCRLHGGLTPSGVASPHFQTGRYSKYLPERMLERYQEAQTDAELVELREEISLTDARLADLLKKVDTGESGALWAKVQKHFDKYAELRHKTEKFVEAEKEFNTLESYIQAGISDRYAWAEIAAQVEQRRKLVESEGKRLKDMQQSITAEKAMTLIAALAGIVRKHVTDRNTLAAISTDLIQLTAGRISGEAESV